MSIPSHMRAMVLQSPGSPLAQSCVPIRPPGPQEILVRIRACGVCRTDLHVVDGELPDLKIPLIPGHQVVGTVQALGEGVRTPQVGGRVGIPWLGWTCGSCVYCRKGRENLCDGALFTGYTRDGGYAEYVTASRDYCLPVPSSERDDCSLAPLLCAGLIGYRAYRMAGEDAERLGLYGFGAAAHIVAQIAAWEGRRIYAFTSPGDRKAQDFAMNLGAVWAGDSTCLPPEQLDAAIIFAPVGSLVPAALQAVAKGGTVVCGGIHMSDIPAFPYKALWGERSVRSVANLTRRDGEELLSLAGRIPIRTETSIYPLHRANEALEDLRRGRIQGAAVLVVEQLAT